MCHAATNHSLSLLLLAEGWAELGSVRQRLTQGEDPTDNSARSVARTLLLKKACFGSTRLVSALKIVYACVHDMYMCVYIMHTCIHSYHIISYHIISYKFTCICLYA